VKLHRHYSESIQAVLQLELQKVHVLQVGTPYAISPSRGELTGNVVGLVSASWGAQKTRSSGEANLQ
jgi:hypothetical protein